jgi:hypothetical protein
MTFFARGAKWGGWGDIGFAAEYVAAEALFARSLRSARCPNPHAVRHSMVRRESGSREGVLSVLDDIIFYVGRAIGAQPLACFLCAVTAYVLYSNDQVRLHST